MSAVACWGLVLALALVPLMTACTTSDGTTITEDMVRNLLKGSSRGLSAPALGAQARASSEEDETPEVDETEEPEEEETPEVEETEEPEEEETPEAEETEEPDDEDEVGDDQDDEVEDDQDEHDADEDGQDKEDDDEGEEESRLLPGYRLTFAAEPVIA